jgi:putative glycerol-1-phosphate prenyltransferase
MANIYSTILDNKKKRKKLFSVLIDPDKFDSSEVITLCEDAAVDFIMVGGSIITQGNFENCIQTIKKLTKIPIIIFPGNYMQISDKADAILLLSLISGRNADLLIGNHVLAASALKSSNLEILSTGYMLIDSGKQTTALYISNTIPIPNDKSDIAASTAIAGEMLGLKLMYLDAGSGAMNCINENMIERVSKNISSPLIVGGGINSVKKAEQACKAGADMIVIGNSIEKDKTLITSISKAIHEFQVVFTEK